MPYKRIAEVGLAFLMWATFSSLTGAQEARGLLWTYAAPEKILFAPTVASDGTSYFSTDDEQVRAVSPSGQLLWGIDAGGKPTSGIAFQGGLLFFGTSQAELAAYGANGHMAWRTQVDDIILSTPAVAADGTIYAVTRKGTVYAVNPKGKIHWVYETGNDVVFSPAVAHSGRIYVASTKNFFALGPGGNPVWITSLAVPPGSQMAIDAHDGLCYVDATGSLHHLDSKGVDWNSDPAVSTFTGAPVVSSDNVYLCEGSGPAPPTGYSISGTVTLSPGNTGLGGVSISTGAGTGSTTTAGNGTYTVSNLVNGSYTVTPSLSGYTFDPTSTPVTISSANVTDINFTATASSAARKAVPQGALPPSPGDGGQNQTTAYKLLDGTPVWTDPPQFGNSFTPALVAGGSIFIPSNDSSIDLLDSSGDTSKTIPLGQVPQDIVLVTVGAENRIYAVCGGRFLFCLSTASGPDLTAPWNQLGAGPRHLNRRDDPPTVTITAPTDPNVSGDVALAANVTDDFPEGLTVRFLIDGATVASVTSSPFTATWHSQTYPDGEHTLTAEAKDSAGNVSRADMTLQSNNGTPSNLVYPDTSPVTLTWDPGSSTHFKVQLSASANFSNILAGSGKPGHPWLTQHTWTPDQQTWLKILGAAKGSPGSDTSVFWRALGKGTPSVLLASGQLQISKVIASDQLSPADESPASASQAPQFTWSAEHNREFMVQVSDSAGGFPNEVKLSSETPGAQWLKGTSWTPSAKAWTNVAGKYKGQSLYWRVVAQDAIGRRSNSQVNALAIQN